MTDTEVWKFQADGSGAGQWSIVTASNQEVFKGLRQSEHASVAFTNDTGFAIGGLATGWTEKDRSVTQALPGIVSLSFRNSAFKNETVPAGSPFETLVGGQARWIPGFGPNGLIVILGGVKPSVTKYESISKSDPVDFANLTFFDPVTKEVYAQTATGTIPPAPRVNFCNVAFRTPNGGYDIFIFGGSNERDKLNYDDAYILSLPGFVWTKVASSPAGKRYHHACVGVGNRQVLVIGGPADGIEKTADPAPQGLHLFDMTALSWKYSYEANDSPYESAASIKAWYANGSLDSVEWSSPKVKALFATGASTSQTATSPSGSSPTGSAQDGLESDGGSKSTSAPIGAIAGGVVGGVALLCIIGLVAFIMIRKSRREQRSGGEKPEEPSELPPSYHDAPAEPHYAEAPGAEAYKYDYVTETRVSGPGTPQSDGGNVPHQVTEVDSGHGYVEMHGWPKHHAVSVGVAPAELDAGNAVVPRH